MVFVVFDEELREEVLSAFLNEKDEVNKIYKFLLSATDRIYNSKNLNAPAIFSSKIFFGDYENWDPSLHTRAIAAVYQLLIDADSLPIWVSWGDIELSGETLRVIYVFSNASKVEGLKGRVLVAQFSDDDREVELEFNGERMMLSTLRGASALYYIVHKKFSEKPLDETINRSKEIIDEILKEIDELAKELEIGLEKREEVKAEEEELLKLPELDEELGGLDIE